MQSNLIFIFHCGTSTNFLHIPKYRVRQLSMRSSISFNTPVAIHTQIYDLWQNASMWHSAVPHDLLLDLTECTVAASELMACRLKAWFSPLDLSKQKPPYSWSDWSLSLPPQASWSDQENSRCAQRKLASSPSWWQQDAHRPRQKNIQEKEWKKL